MKKIKLVISDIHLSQGLKLPNGTTNPLEEFHYDQQFAEFLRYYSMGEWADYEVELIINGDFLNFIQIDYKGFYLNVITEDIDLHKLKAIVDGHPLVFESLREFASDPKRSLTYVVGNHDQGMLWPKCREYLDDVLETKVKYKSIVYYFDGVHIEHGHMHEAANRLNPKKFFLKKDLPEPILNLPFGSHFFIEFVMRIKRERNPHIDKIRPLGNAIRWWLIHDTINSLKILWSLLSYFFMSLFNTDPKRGWNFRQIIKIFLQRAVFPDLSGAARKILSDRRVHTVIFGHSHVYQYRQFGEEKEYFNTGTWTEVTSLELASLGKFTKLTYVLLEYFEDPSESAEDEEPEFRPRGRLKEWRGFHRISEDVVIS
ncbi:MAG: metallophosphoesterase [Bdellovibrionales bacterium]